MTRRNPFHVVSDAPQVGRMLENDELYGGNGDGPTFVSASNEWPSPRDPMAVARRLVSDCWSFGTVPTLRCWRRGFYEWQTTHWRQVEDRRVSSRVSQLLEHAVYVDDKGNEVPWRPNKYT